LYILRAYQKAGQSEQILCLQTVSKSIRTEARALDSNV